MTRRRLRPETATDDWRHHAACLGEDPELFFPVGNIGPALIQIEQAKAVCWRCPVLNQCRTEARANREVAGIWGGLSEDERRPKKRRPQPRPQPQPASYSFEAMTNAQLHRIIDDGATTEPRTPARCGTQPGYRKHLREHTRTCGPCRAAHATWGATYTAVGNHTGRPHNFAAVAAAREILVQRYTASRISDHNIARLIGVTTPTVPRIRARLREQAA